jgi:hypothetical protein
MQPDGIYKLLEPQADEEAVDSQTFFLTNNSNQWRAR